MLEHKISVAVEGAGIIIALFTKIVSYFTA